MGLFKRKEKLVEENNTIDKHEKRYQISYSKSYKGFKRFNVVVFGNEESERNNKIMIKSKIDVPSVDVLCSDLDGFTEPKRMAILFINGMKVGAIFMEDQVAAIENGRIEALHAEPGANDERLHFFAKYLSAR